MTAHVAVYWIPFSSTVFPYSITQPSSFKYEPITNTAHQKIDFFSPSLGSFVTDVSIFAVPGSRVPDPTGYLRDQGGFKIHRSGSVTIQGIRRTLTCADFTSFGVRWREEQVSFAANGMVWRLTSSYNLKYRSLRPLMIRMISHFKLRTTGKKR